MDRDLQWRDYSFLNSVFTKAIDNGNWIDSSLVGLRIRSGRHSQRSVKILESLVIEYQVRVGLLHLRFCQGVRGPNSSSLGTVAGLVHTLSTDDESLPSDLHLSASMQARQASHRSSESAQAALGKGCPSAFVDGRGIPCVLSPTSETFLDRRYALGVLDGHRESRSQFSFWTRS